VIHRHSRRNHTNGRRQQPTSQLQRHRFIFRVAQFSLWIEEARVWGECTCSDVGSIKNLFKWTRNNSNRSRNECWQWKYYHNAILWCWEWNYYCRMVVVACLFYDLDRDLVGQDHPTAIQRHRRRRRSEISPNGIVLFTFGFSRSTYKICIKQSKNYKILSKNIMCLFSTLIL